VNADQLKTIIATDCGSTTTKAILIEKVGEVYRQTFRGESPTTVEAPFEDVTRGVLNSIQEVEELSGRKILDGERIITPAQDNAGVDAYISTSSAGGGLQMMVAGAVKTMTAESAQRAALGAGAIVMDVLASNDKRLPHEKIERIRYLRPDMILLSGGTDGGTISHVEELAQYIAAADPKPRLGIGYRLPVLFAGNVDARPRVAEMLDEKMELVITANLRPTLERENLMPARLEIQRLFLEHVMAQAPGYKKLMDWTSTPIMPTPAAVGLIMQTIARPNIMRWLAFDVDERDVRDRVKNKMIRPTTIPQTLVELKLEQAIAREALRLSFDQHKLLAVGLKGVQQERTLAEAFTQSETGKSLIKMMELNMIVGSGGVLSHAPRRNQSMGMMIDAFQPEGITNIAVDSIFMMPHLGVLSEVHPQAATEVFEKDCLIRLGVCVAPKGRAKPGAEIMDYTVATGGETIEDTLTFGEIRFYPLGVGETAEIELKPSRGLDVGNGPGRSVQATVTGGVVGLVLDGRGRPLVFPKDPAEHKQKTLEWNGAMQMYPSD